MVDGKARKTRSDDGRLLRHEVEKLVKRVDLFRDEVDVLEGEVKRLQKEFELRDERVVRIEGVIQELSAGSLRMKDGRALRPRLSKQYMYREESTGVMRQMIEVDGNGEIIWE